MPRSRAEMVARVKALVAEGKSLGLAAAKEQRTLTAQESARVEGALAEAKELVAEIKALDESGAAPEPEPQKANWGTSLPNANAVPLEDLQKAFGGTGTSAVKSVWAKEVARRLTSPDYAAKALTTGGIDIPTVVDPTQEPLPAARATRILELLPRAPLTVNSYGYLQQTARTPNAAPVADNDPKPTSVYTWEDFEDRARVIAHLSEPIPRRYFSDVAELQRVLQDEMAEDLLIQLETQCVSGSGTGENFTGVLTASSVPFQPFVTDIWTTCRRARTTLELANVTPNAWVFHPTDLETIDLIREGSGATAGGFLLDAEGMLNVFGPYARISSPGVPQGTAILADWSKARLRVRENISLRVDESGPLFQKNQIQFLCEGRFNLDILRPGAFLEVDLTA